MQHIRDNVKTTALVATAVFLLVYGLQFAWATVSTVLADHKSLLARIRLLHNETENLKHSLETWKQPASMSGGPVGPIAAVEIVDLFRKLPQPCLVRVTYHDDTKEFGETLKWILTQPQGASCKEDQQPNEPISVDTQGETPIPTNESGIVFHCKQTFAAGNELAQTLYRSGYRIVMSHKMPPNSQDNLVWLDIGHGSPWKLK
jgi:hypothetical protein